jgi:predicted tellurium resistance membrane protein TerC
MNPPPVRSAVPSGATAHQRARRAGWFSLWSVCAQDRGGGVGHAAAEGDDGLRGFVAVLFGIGLGVAEGRDIAAQYFTGYVLEFSLSLDNVFVWALILSAFAVPPAYQHRLLFYGIFGVTREPFVVFSATAFALVGLRSLCFLLDDARDRFAYLDYGLAAILIFIGAKFVVADVVHIGVGVSLVVIVAVMATAIGASLLHARRTFGQRRATAMSAAGYGTT